jgi:hypothetical protein
MSQRRFVAQAATLTVEIYNDHRTKLKKHDSSSAIVGTKRLLSKKRFLISQLVSATKRQPWQAAP